MDEVRPKDDWGWVKILPPGPFDLPEALARLREIRSTHHSAAHNAVIDRSTRQLRNSHDLDRVPRPGSTAPEFELRNAFGEQRSLGGFLARGPVVLTFYRGSWCPFCNLELRALQQHLPRITELGATLVAISGMTPDNSLTLAQRLELGYEVLSDTDLAVARSYGLVHDLPAELQEMYSEVGHPVPSYHGTSRQALPIPGTFVLDAEGVVRFVHADPDYMYRADPAQILEVLDRLR
ncbi:peroxiredoxin-like family protein [Amycolatopsis sp. NPDC004368]